MYASCVYYNVTANAIKTMTANKMNDRDKMPTAHSSTFGFADTQSQTKNQKSLNFANTQT
ncbi:MAG: hypothetical protein EAZ55_13120 [Cytophagales bacterium]|nr:MAG: hypothetical protein EAZ55_13120 [Cytophagales bacterium]